MSFAVLNTPACPATPPSDHAFSSCTLPRTIPRGGLASYSVAAIRFSFDAGGLYPVSTMPSGAVIRSWTTLSRLCPVSFSTMKPRVSRLMSE